MKRLIVTILFIGIIYIIFSIAYSHLRVFTSGASAIMGMMDIQSNDAERAQIISYYREHVDRTHQINEQELILSDVLINNDSIEDVVATLTSEEVCGSAGCITTIFVREDDVLVPIPFQYATESIVSEQSMTNGMHDLKINGNVMMKWDGERYMIE